jgi:hypothetical protein
MLARVSPRRTVYLVGGTGVLGWVGTGEGVGVSVGGAGVGVSVGTGVSVAVGTGVCVGSRAAAARDRSHIPPPANNNTITPATMATSSQGARRGAGGAAAKVSSSGTTTIPDGVSSEPQIRHVLARDETLAPQLGQVRGRVSEREGGFSMKHRAHCILRNTKYTVRSMLTI